MVCLNHKKFLLKMVVVGVPLKANSLHFLPDNFTNKTTLYDLPNEILHHIFSFLTNKELFYLIRPVCKKFQVISMDPRLWKVIEADKEIPTQIVQQWIKIAKFLKSFNAKDRNDGNLLASEISKSCKNIESIKLQNCWGSTQSLVLHSTPLCNLITRCKKLCSIDFSQCRFASCKFFRLISKDLCNGPRVRKCSYSGPMNPKQMQALFSALSGLDIHDSATITNVHLSNTLHLKDIMKNIDNEVTLTPELLNNVWENLNLDSNELSQDNMNVEV